MKIATQINVLMITGGYWVRGSGKFFELEAVYEDPALEKKENEKIKILLDKFGVQEKDLLQGSYREMVRKNATQK